MMKISIITVCFNSEATIEKTLLSISQQSYDCIEHIIIDGGSTDHTLAIIAACDTHTIKLISESDDGIYDAMNKGFLNATGDIIGFLNSDDIFASTDSLSLIAQAFEDSSIDACYGDLIYFSKNSNEIVRYWKSKPYVENLFSTGWMPAHPTFYIRKNVYEKLGGFNLDYKIAGDFEYTMRLLHFEKIKSTYIPYVLIKMRLGGASNRNILNIIKSNLECLRACKAYNLDYGFFFIINKFISKIPQFFKHTY